MLNNRIIPVLLMDNGAAVKTKQFANPVYIGDIINAVSIFNSKQVDELMVFDISAGRRGSIDAQQLRRLGEECFMPLCYGGGLSSVSDAATLLRSGVEKVSVNTVFHETGGFVHDASRAFGSSSVVVGIDALRDASGTYSVYTRAGTRKLDLDPVDQAKRAVDAGAGEIVIQSIANDGMRCGYDLELVRSITAAVPVPVVALGGAHTVDHLGQVIREAGATTAAAGSMFVMYGPLSAVLITYPDDEARRRALSGL